MATNVQNTFQADVEAYIADKTLPLARRQLVAYQLGDKLELDKGRGLTYTATRFNRLPLPAGPLSEGVPPVGEQMGLAQVSATAQQWGDKVTITDVAEMTIKHPLFKQAMELTALQIGETLDRNVFNALAALTQVNYVNSRGSRGALVAGDVLNPHDVNRTVATLKTLGAPRWGADEQTDERLRALDGGKDASKNPRVSPHYVAICHTLVVGDFSENPTVQNAWSYSDINRLYNYEVGEWRGMRFCDSNMVPSWTGIAQVNGNPVVGGGTFAAGNYFVLVTGSDTQNQYESQIAAVSNTIAVGANGSITVQLPNTIGFTWNVYVGTTNTPTNLATSAAGPLTGPFAGQATQLPTGALVTITGTGIAQTPPAAPGNGITVYPTYVVGRGAYGNVVLDDVRFTYLKEADKSDPLNQLRIVGWKCFYGTIIQNNQFAARIESTSKFSSSFG